MPTGAPHSDDPRSDAQLVDAINAGDPRAFDALYFRHRDWVANLAHRYTRDHALALDAMQETFLYLLGKFDTADGGRGFTLTARMTTFLFPVVRHIALRLRDKAHRSQAGPESALDRVESMPSPQAGPESSKVRVALAHVMSALPETHREVVLLRFVDSFTLEEIAAALDIPVGTVKSRLHHALRQLRDDPAVRDYFAPDV